MGLFSKFLEKKVCDFCGEEIKLLGNRKLEDGNMCKNCASKLSPWFSERRSSTIAEIQEQLDYREANKDKVEAFNVTRTLGLSSTKVLIDENAGNFIVTSARDWKKANPDVMKLSDVTAANLIITDSKSEVMRTDKDGKRVSYMPKRYEYRYNFTVKINVNNPYFNEISFGIGSAEWEESMNINFNPYNHAEYVNKKNAGDDIVRELTMARSEARAQVVREQAPKQAVTCPWCGATTTPDANGCCEYCGGSVNG
ncbi:MAG: DUF4428 domain-containing protein [Clostridia bacterium]|nr:DUF4428 domain-containing protein [Clostridia bacterium]